MKLLIQDIVQSVNDNYKPRKMFQSIRNFNYRLSINDNEGFHNDHLSINRFETLAVSSITYSSIKINNLLQ